MAGNQIYDSAAVFCNKVFLAEIETIEVDEASGVHPIITMGKGFAGISPGAQQITVQLKGAIPRAGLEFDFRSALQNNTEIELVWFAHSKTMSSKGYLTQSKQSYSASNPSSIDATFIGRPVDEN